MLLKKTYLDNRLEEKELYQLNAEEVQGLKNTIGQSINFDQPLNLLKKKSEIICKLYKKTEEYN